MICIDNIRQEDLYISFETYTEMVIQVYHICSNPVQLYIVSWIFESKIMIFQSFIAFQICETFLHLCIFNKLLLL